MVAFCKACISLYNDMHVDILGSCDSLIIYVSTSKVSVTQYKLRMSTVCLGYSVLGKSYWNTASTTSM